MKILALLLASEKPRKFAYAHVSLVEVSSRRDNWCASYPGIKLATLCSAYLSRLSLLAVIFLPFILAVLSSRSILSPRKRNSQISLLYIALPRLLPAYPPSQ